MELACESYLRFLGIERGRSANTLAAYRRDLSAYLRFLAARRIDRPDGVRPDDVGAFVHELTTRTEPTLAASSVARMLSSVRGLHRFLLDEGMTPADPGVGAASPKPGMRLPKAISIDQMTALLDATPLDTTVSLRDRALLELLYATGARVSELVSLNVDDLNDPEYVRLLGKGDKQRRVPVGRFARDAVQAYLVRARPVLSRRGSFTPALFLGARGARLSRQNVWLIIRAAAVRAGLGVEISPHTFRHSFATHLLSGGADVRVVQELLGHASVATTQIYTLVTADALRDMYLTAHPRARDSLTLNQTSR